MSTKFIVSKEIHNFQKKCDRSDYNIEKSREKIILRKRLCSEYENLVKIDSSRVSTLEVFCQEDVLNSVTKFSHKNNCGGVSLFAKILRTSLLKKI